MNAETAQIEALAKEIMRRCLAEEEAADILEWLRNAIAHLGGGDDTAIMTWPESFDFTLKMLEQYEALANTPEALRKDLSWPWESWRRLIDAPEDGMLGVVTAPDGQGKTIYAESIAEHWAMKKNGVVFVHYELNRKLMMQRRTARYASILPRDQKAGHLTAEQKDRVRRMNTSLAQWEGLITYLHTPGWTMERTVSQLEKFHAEGNCDAVVLDYLEKASPSPRQIKMFGSNAFMREADNVEQLKNFAERTGIPVLMVAQMNKEGKKESAEKMDRTAMRGAGEKSEKANLVVLLKRERDREGYSPIVEVVVDKNTMGGTGTFKQFMQPEFFRVADIEKGAK